MRTRKVGSLITTLLDSVISMNFWIFEYLNEMDLKYYSYSYSCQPNKFKNLFVNSKIIEYIWIFAQNLILIFAYLFLWRKKIRYNLCITNIQYNILFRGSRIEPFSKFPHSVISRNIQIFKKINPKFYCISICAIFGIQIYLDIRSVKMWHPNIFGYFFST